MKNGMREFLSGHSSLLALSRTRPTGRPLIGLHGGAGTKSVIKVQTMTFNVPIDSHVCRLFRLRYGSGCPRAMVAATDGSSERCIASASNSSSVSMFRGGVLDDAAGFSLEADVTPDGRGSGMLPDFFKKASRMFFADTSCPSTWPRSSNTCPDSYKVRSKINMQLRKSSGAGTGRLLGLGFRRSRPAP